MILEPVRQWIILPFFLPSFTTFDIPKMFHLALKHHFIAWSFYNNSGYQPKRTKLCSAFSVLHLLGASPSVSRCAGSHQVSISVPCLSSVANNRNRRSKIGVTVVPSQASVIFSPGPFVVWLSVNPGQPFACPTWFCRSLLHPWNIWRLLVLTFLWSSLFSVFF